MYEICFNNPVREGSDEWGNIDYELVIIKVGW